MKEMMTSVSDLAVLEEGSTLFEAILAIGAARGDNPASPRRCPAVLVSNGDRRITGFLDFRKMLKGLEPKYGEIAETMEGNGVSAEWVKSMLKKHGLWANAFDDICKKAGEIIIRNLMTVPTENQITNVNTSLNEAVFQMVVTGNDYLFVRDGELLAGVISLSDIVTHVCDTVKDCRV